LIGTRSARIHSAHEAETREKTPQAKQKHLKNGHIQREHGSNSSFSGFADPVLK
jgi:hypothetical protein